MHVVERYSVCRCLYYRHSIDPCAARGQRGHGIQEKTVLVGYACDQHSRHRCAALPPRASRHVGSRSRYSDDSWAPQFIQFN
ncbi:hypothetical protein BTJ68_01199 [Hortaea werneckii EXF-2000]|uniref:Uncharacterized protein n=1 Tax=Hortaea werneckii EXF-2000 TaxID=1157616 RepID=A0A1Z5TRY0_HORWE|nr:hypothetical protein BTJ68_01199 [Hortaea werneckii EXF-2000]